MALAASLTRAPFAFASPAIRLVKGPYLTGLSDTSVDVRFELDGSPVATVTVTPDEGAGDASTARRIFENAGSPDLHRVRVTGLVPGTHYAYAVRVAHAVIGGGHFTTAPAADSSAPITFLVYGDNRTDPAAHAAVVRAMGDVPSDFLVNTGDLVADGASAADWQSFFDVEAAMLCDRPLFVGIGNHELSDDTAGSNFAKYFGFAGATSSPSLYGTARIGSVRFFFLNAMHDWGSGEEHDWLVRELERADGEAGLTWRIAVTHHSPWSSGPHGPSANLVDAHVPELLAAHKVDLILAGHDHIYERGDGGGLKYIISGGGGAPLYRVLANNPASRKAEATYHFVELTAATDALRIVARRADGTILERCGFRKGAPWDCDPPPASPRPEPVAAAAPAPSPSARCGCRVVGAKGSRAPASFALSLCFVGALARRRRCQRRLRSTKCDVSPRPRSSSPAPPPASPTALAAHLR